MAHEVLKGAPVSAKAQTEANETGSPSRGKFGRPTTKGDFMEFDEEREAVGTVGTAPTAAPAAPAAGAASASSEALKTAVRKVLLNNRMTQDRMAREAGLSGSALSQWLHGKYQGDVPALEGRLVAWLATPSTCCVFSSLKWCLKSCAQRSKPRAVRHGRTAPKRPLQNAAKWLPSWPVNAMA